MAEIWRRITVLKIGDLVKGDRPNCILLNRNYLHYFVGASPRACPRLLSILPADRTFAMKALNRAYHLKVSFCNNSIAFVTSLDAIAALTSNASSSWMGKWRSQFLPKKSSKK
jgi:hypothetical protein